MEDHYEKITCHHSRWHHLCPAFCCRLNEFLHYEPGNTCCHNRCYGSISTGNNGYNRTGSAGPAMVRDMEYYLARKRWQPDGLDNPAYAGWNKSVRELQLHLSQ